MGTTMTAIAEVRCADGWTLVDQPVFPYPDEGRPSSTPFRWKGYGMYGFLAGIRNLSQTAVLSEPRGVPEDISEASAERIIDGRPSDESASLWEPAPASLVELIEEAAGAREEYGFSWLTAKELLDFNYDTVFLDMAEEPPCTKTYREVLGASYFEHLKVLRVLGHPDGVRIIFWFNE